MRPARSSQDDTAARYGTRNLEAALLRSVLGDPDAGAGMAVGKSDSKALLAPYGGSWRVRAVSWRSLLMGEIP
jgi:hypothetical protein